MDYIEKLELETEEIEEVETLEKRNIINNDPVSVEKYEGHTEDFLTLESEYDDGFNQLEETNGFGIKCIVAKRVSDINSSLEKTVKFKVVGNGVIVPPVDGDSTVIPPIDGEGETVPPSSGGSTGDYIHPATHPASMITGLSKVATSGSYNDLSDIPTMPTQYVHPTSHPASIITGLSNVSITGSYNDLSDKPSKLSNFTNDLPLNTVAYTGHYSDLLYKPTKLSEFENDLDIGTSVTTVSTLDSYSGATLSEKMVNMFNDINANHKNTPMDIVEKLKELSVIIELE